MVVPPHVATHASTRLQAALESLGSVLTRPAGTVLFERGQEPKGVYLLKTGAAHMWMPCEGDHEILSREAGPGDVLGLPATMSGKGYSLSARLTEESQVIFVERNLIREYLKHDTELCFEILALLSREVQTARNNLST